LSDVTIGIIISTIKMVKHNRRIDKVTRISESEFDRRGYLSLDKNERLTCFSDSFIRNIRKKVTSELLSSYPNLHNSYEELSKHAGVSSDEIFISAGSEYSIKYIIEAFLEPGVNIVLHKPSYAMYEIYSKIAGAQVKSVNFNNNFTLPIDSLLKEIDKKTRVLVVENPNGFIGSSISFQQLESIAQECNKRNICLVVDEAYYGFCKVTAVPLIKKYNNVIVVRSFSKVYGLAGLRIGYCISNRKMISLIEKIRPMHEITSFSAMVLEEILGRKDEIDDYIASINQANEFTYKQLHNIDVFSLKTEANFIVSKLPANLDQKYFMKKKILVRRPFGEHFLNGYTRITIGNKDNMKKFIRIIKNFMDK